jgi:uncharacterized protein (DUF1501 family)
MKRRDFIKLMSFAGVTTVLPNALTVKKAHAAFPYTGLLYINVVAQGGMDTSSFCDPKQRTDVNNWAQNNTIGSSRNTRFAPIANNASFFNKYSGNMLVINGIHGRTNSHVAGLRHQLTGTLANGFPTTEGILSATAGNGIPLAYLSRSRFAETGGGLIKYSRPNAQVIKQVTQPNLLANNNLRLSPTALNLVKQAQYDRSMSSLDKNYLPQMNEKITELIDSQASSSILRQFGNSLPTSFARVDLTGSQYRQVTEADIALHGMKEGVCCSASFDIGSFDTHNNHDARHTPLLAQLTNFVDFIWTKASSFGIDNRLVVTITSDFSRTPSYNGSNGKDHWPVGSAIVMKKNENWTNRVVGATSGKHEAIAINPLTLREDSTNGIVIEPKHVHSMLRRIAGIENSPIVNQFDLEADFIDFLNPNLSTGYPHTT